MAECHPDRPVCAFGVCKPCWTRGLYGPEHKSTRRMADCHPDRPSVSNGICGYCYHKKRQREGKIKPNRKMATCHPDRPHASRGLCQSCYNSKVRQEGNLNPNRKMATCHPDRPHRARGMCASCLGMFYQSRSGSRPKRRNAEVVRRSKLKRVYGLTVEQFDAMAASQGGKCAICRQEQKGKRLAVDHCHATGRVRRLLCNNCNTAIGYFKEDLQVMRAAIAYLQKHGGGAR